MNKRIAGTIAALGLALGAGAATAPAAQAGTACDLSFGVICGTVVNVGTSWWGKVDSNLGDNKVWDKWVRPGESTNGLIRDVDAIYADRGTKITLYSCSTWRYVTKYGSNKYAISKKITDLECYRVIWSAL